MTDNRPKLLISSSDFMMVTLEVSIRIMSSSTSGLSTSLAKARRAQGRLQEAWATWRQSAGDAHFAALSEEAKTLDALLYNVLRMNVKGTKQSLLSCVTFPSYHCPWMKP